MRISAPFEPVLTQSAVCGVIESDRARLIPSGPAVAVILDIAKLLSASDNLEEHLLVFRILALGARFGDPDHAIAVDPAAIVSQTKLSIGRT